MVGGIVGREQMVLVFIGEIVSLNFSPKVIITVWHIEICGTNQFEEYILVPLTTDVSYNTTLPHNPFLHKAKHTE